MKIFHDVKIYSGAVLATTGSRLEIGAKNKFLRQIFSGLADCATCREPLAIIFAEEEESTLREVFNKVSHFNSTPGRSIIESKPLLITLVLPSKLYSSDPGKVDSLLQRLSLMASQEMSGSSVESRVIADGGREGETLQVEMDTTGEL